MATKKKAEAPAKRPPGRPSDYSEEMATLICNRMINGESLRSICRDTAMPDPGTVLRWASKNPEFRQQYDDAMAQRAESMFEEILDIADETSRDTIDTETGERANTEWISRSRLRVDARKWMLSKMVPKKYGDALRLGGEGEDGAITVVIKDWTGRKRDDDAAD